MRDRSERVLRASEVGQYAYCARAWWLGSVQGLPSSRSGEMKLGASGHRRHGHRVRRTVRVTSVAYLSLGLALLTGLVWLIQAVVAG